MSEAAENLLARVVVLGEASPDGYVADEVLWDAANLSYEEYVDAADELVKSGFAESKADASEFPSLRATPEGRATLPAL
jgi:hypothetical protein